jgi:hypothetical protein
VGWQVRECENLSINQQKINSMSLYVNLSHFRMASPDWVTLAIAYAYAYCLLIKFHYLETNLN